MKIIERHDPLERMVPRKVRDQYPELTALHALQEDYGNAEAAAVLFWNGMRLQRLLAKCPMAKNQIRLLEEIETEARTALNSPGADKSSEIVAYLHVGSLLLILPLGGCQERAECLYEAWVQLEKNGNKFEKWIEKSLLWLKAMYNFHVFRFKLQEAQDAEAIQALGEAVRFRHESGFEGALGDLFAQEVVDAFSRLVSCQHVEWRRAEQAFELICDFGWDLFRDDVIIWDGRKVGWTESCDEAFYYCEHRAQQQDEDGLSLR